jgi:hypothetical protein
MKLLVPIGLGVIAGLVNYAAMQQKLQPVTFVAASRDLRVGDSLSDSDWQALTLSGDVASMKSSAVLWEDRKVLWKKKAGRSLRKGDMFFLSDALQAIELQPGDGEVAMAISLDRIPYVPRFLLVGEKIGFLIEQSKNEAANPPANPPAGTPAAPRETEPAYVGPFRLLSVGERLSRTQPDDAGTAVDTSGRGLIYVGIRLDESTKQLDEASRRLVLAQVPDMTGRQKILGIVLHGNRQKAGGLADTH